MAIDHPKYLRGLAAVMSNPTDARRMEAAAKHIEALRTVLDEVLTAIGNDGNLAVRLASLDALEQLQKGGSNE